MIRIQLRRTKGWRLPPGAVVVARPSPWGNPFRVGANPWYGTVARMDRAQAVDAFRRIVHPPGYVDGLRGATALACWCPLDGQPCHADVLIELLEATA